MRVLPERRTLLRLVRLDTNVLFLTCCLQIEGPTQLNPYGLKSTLAPRSDKVQRERQNMTVLALEVFGKCAT